MTHDEKVTTKTNSNQKNIKIHQKFHAHSLDSMWYETDETKPQTKEGVIDIQYMTKNRKNT